MIFKFLTAFALLSLVLMSAYCGDEQNMITSPESYPRTLRELKDEIRSTVFPGQEQENLLKAHDLMFIEGLGELQKDVPELQEINCDVIEFCRTFTRCGLTIVGRPPGVITRVYTVQKREGRWDWCNAVNLSERDYREVDAWTKRFRGFVKDDEAFEALPKDFPLGFQKADAANDSKWGRAHSGIYAIHDSNICIAPWIQSDEAIVIEWKGIKPVTRWSDDDLVDGSPEFKQALKLFFQYAHERDFGTDPEQRSALHENWIESRSELMLQRREETRVKEQDVQHRKRHHCGLWPFLLGQPHPIHDEDDELVFAHIGNNGVNNSDSDAVAAAVKALDDLKAILSTGGNIPTLINLVPAGSVYDSEQSLEISLLGFVVGAQYKITFGSREVELNNDGDFIANPGAGQTVTFIAGDTGLHLVGNNDGPVTAVIHKVSTTQSSSYDLTIGRSFFNYISPYVGVYGEGSSKNKFFPTIDDGDTVDSLAAYEAFFSGLPNNKRYYDVCYGPVHFFFIDSSGFEPDGYTPESKQGDWLRLELTLSTAKWKVVVESGPPYSSDSADQKTNARWPYQQWGADLVLSGGAQNYERFSIGGFPYIVNGLGGIGKDTAVTQTAGSQIVYFATFGYGKITVTKDHLIYQFYAVDGTLIDTLTL
jgi:hypothetical protein